MEKKMQTIKEVAEKYNVTTMAVRHWIKKYDIETKTERVVGIKPRIILNILDLQKKLGLTVMEG